MIKTGYTVKASFPKHVSNNEKTRRKEKWENTMKYYLNTIHNL